LDDSKLMKKMGDFPNCPNCATEGLTVPLSEEGDSMVCSLCGYSEKIQ
jgi:ribosomal protein S27AE